jgi:hypothetical protein
MKAEWKDCTSYSRDAERVPRWCSSVPVTSLRHWRTYES